ASMCATLEGLGFGDRCPEDNASSLSWDQSSNSGWIGIDRQIEKRCAIAPSACTLAAPCFAKPKSSNPDRDVEATQTSLLCAWRSQRSWRFDLQCTPFCA